MKKCKNLYFSNASKYTCKIICEIILQNCIESCWGFFVPVKILFSILGTT